MKPRWQFPGGVVLLLVTLSCSPDDPTTPDSPGAAAAFDNRPRADQPAGMLRLCKVAGEGVAAGEAFSFGVTLAEVARVFTVGAGSCADVEAARESAPRSRGFFQNDAAAVLRLLPGGTLLDIDDAELSASEVMAILGSAPTVKATGTLLRNLVQQLIAAQLNVLRGVQPSAATVQAMADANAGIRIDVGADIVLTTSLGQAQQSALVTALTAFNEGKTKPPAPPPTVGLHIVEHIGTYVEVTAISCDPAAACTGIDVAGGSVPAVVSSGATTTVSYTNRAKPRLRLCKVAGTGIETGTTFDFDVDGVGMTSSVDATVAAGDCADLVLPVGSHLVAERIPADAAVSAIACDPAARCSIADVANGRVEVAIVHGATTVTFTNRSTLGTLRICKIAGPGVEAGRMFTFGAHSSDLSVTRQIDAAPGDCGETRVPEREYLVFEHTTPNPDLAVSSITCEPAARCANPSLPLATVRMTIVAGETTTAFYTNRTNLGTVRVCKVAGPGIEAGQAFDFSVSGGGPSTPLQVAAGSCEEVMVREGDGRVIEQNAPGHRATSITCEPTARCGQQSPGLAFVDIAVVGAETLTVTYTNRSTLGTVRICKVAGPGIEAGRLFDFHVSPTTSTGAVDLQVGAGDCADVPVGEGASRVIELNAPGHATTDIACSPEAQCGQKSLGLAFVDITVVASSVLEVTYTNRSTLGTVRVCKVAGPGIQNGRLFDFSVSSMTSSNSTPVQVPAGECRDVVVREGAYRVIEQTDPGAYAITSITCDPTASCGQQSLGLGFVEATVVAQSTITVTFTNAVPADEPAPEADDATRPPD